MTCRKICRMSFEFWRYFKSTAVGQVVACAPVTHRARVRSWVGTSFLGEVFFRDFPHLSDKFQEALGPKVPEYHLAIILIANHSLRAPMTWDVDASWNPKYTYTVHTLFQITIQRKILNFTIYCINIHYSSLRINEFKFRIHHVKMR